MLTKKNQYVVAVVGATGAIGKELVEILEDRNFPIAELVPLASERSEGERVPLHGKNWTVKKLAKSSFHGIDIAFFTGAASQTLEFAPAAVAAGAVVIDLSSAFGSDPKVPFVIPELNREYLKKHSGIIASPNCAAIGLISVLKPIHDAAGIKRVVVTTLQSVSSSGRKAIDELAGQTVSLLNFRDVEKKVYPHQIAFNCLPHVDEFLDSGSTKEEVKIADETRKLLGDESIRVSVTAVRVPVFRGHSESVNLETKKKITANDVRVALASAEGIIVYDDPKKKLYPLPVDVAGKDEIYVGRIREDGSISNGINLWLVLDNVRKGSALNAVQIAEELIR